jgi:hypothetical protein
MLTEGRTLFAFRLVIGCILISGVAPLLGHAGEPKVSIYAGGVAGITDLADPNNSKSFRAGGGGLYLHNSGWTPLDRRQKERILDVFKRSPIAIEIGYGVNDRVKAWATLVKTSYVDLGINPVFICANAFAEGNEPSEAEWKDFVKGIRDTGIPKETLVLPTLEYQNFGKNQKTLLANRISVSTRFQAIIRHSGGLVLDAPPGYFLYEREPAYREWVVDAIQWTRKQKLKAVLIVSPHKSGKNYADHTQEMLTFLRQRSAMPSAIVSENYVEKPPKDYPNVVGSESRRSTTLGVAYSLLRTVGRTGK